MNAFKTALLLSFVSMASASAAIITPAFPMIQKAWGLSNNQLSAMVSIFLLGYLLGQWIYGPLANRFGRIQALKIGFILNVIGLICSYLSAEFNIYSLFLASRLLTALGASAGLVCTFVLLNEYFEPAKSKMLFPFIVLSFTLGIGLSTFLGGLLSQYFSWPVVFIPLLIQGLLSIAVLRIFPETLRQAQPISISHVLSGYGSALRSKKLISYAFWVGYVSCFSYGYSTIAPQVTQSWFGLNAGAYGTFSLINMVGMFLGSFIATWLLKHFKSKNIIIFSGIGMMLILLCMSWLHACHHLSVLGFFILAGCLYLISSFIFPAASHVASNAIPNKANASGAMNGINLGLAVLSLTLMGLLPASLFMGFLLILLILGAIGLLLLL